MTKSTEVGLRGDLQKINRNKKIGAKLRPPYPREFGKPFVVIMPCSTLTTRYFRDLFQDIQVIVPRKRIQFRKLVDGVEVPSGRLPLFLLATRAAEGRGVLDVMAVSTLPSEMRRVPKYRNCRSFS